MDPEKRAERSHDCYLKLWCYQDELLWGRLKTLSTLQAGIFAGWYILQKHGCLLAVGLAFFGVLLSAMLSLLIYRDQEVRDHHSDQFAAKVDPKNPPKTPDSILIDWPPKAKYWGGGTLILLIVGIFGFTDFFLLVISPCCSCLKFILGIVIAAGGLFVYFKHRAFKRIVNLT